MSSKFFTKNNAVYGMIQGKIWQSQTGHRRQYSMMHALCMLDN